MTKQKEINTIRELVQRIGPDSYIGPWLASVADEAERLIRSDLPIDLSIRETINAALQDATEIKERARQDAESIMKAANTAAEQTTRNADQKRLAVDSHVRALISKLVELTR